MSYKAHAALHSVCDTVRHNTSVRSYFTTRQEQKGVFYTDQSGSIICGEADHTIC